MRTWPTRSDSRRGVWPSVVVDAAGSVDGSRRGDGSGLTVAHARGAEHPARRLRAPGRARCPHGARRVQRAVGAAGAARRRVRRIPVRRGAQRVDGHPRIGLIRRARVPRVRSSAWTTAAQHADTGSARHWSVMRTGASSRTAPPPCRSRDQVTRSGAAPRRQAGDERRTHERKMRRRAARDDPSPRATDARATHG